ncbi:MAG: addiction module protein [Haliscomenobacter sp.]|nr:addiction module protein [Haliscomenobacter sp.]MBK9492909.1 addiction module protein [Haliscomenobacter sp.]
MSKNFENALEQVQQLTRWEQLALIASIAQLIGEDEPDIFPEYVIQENRRRLAAYDAGETQGIPYQEALAYVREQISGT